MDGMDGTSGLGGTTRSVGTATSTDDDERTNTRTERPTETGARSGRGAIVHSSSFDVVASAITVVSSHQSSSSAGQRSWDDDDATVRECARIFRDVERARDEEDEMFGGKSDDDDQERIDEATGRRERRASDATKRREGVETDERHERSPGQSQGTLRVFRCRRRRHDDGKREHG